VWAPPRVSRTRAALVFVLFLFLLLHGLDLIVSLTIFREGVAGGSAGPIQPPFHEGCGRISCVVMAKEANGTK